MNPRNRAARTDPAAPSLPEAVHGNEQADTVVRKDVEVGMEDRRVAGVSDDLVPVAVLVIKAEGHRR